MAITDPSPRALTRREFLKLGTIGVGLTAAATACAPLNPDQASAPTRVPDLARPHDMAGMLSAMTDTTLTLRSPDRARQLSLASNIHVYAPTKTEISRNDLIAGTTVGVWLDEQAAQVTSIQILPLLAGMHDVPADVPQPQPTGETRSFGPLTLISRAGWGAAPPNLNARAEHGVFDPVTNPEGWLVYPEPLSLAFNTVVVHHSALHLDDGPRIIQELHMSIKGYADIAYHFVVDSLGELYEGRVLNARGAHTGGHNTGTVGVVLMGNFNVVEPFTAQMKTLRRLIAYLRDAYYITHIAGHRDFQPDETECPGRYLEKQLPTLATDLSMKFGTDGYVPPAWSKSTK